MFSSGANELIDHLLAKCLPVVCNVAGVPEECIGWTCRDAAQVHYIYIKHDFRRAGAGTRLAFGAQGYSIRTKAGEEFFRKVGAQYNPFPLWIRK